MVPRDRLLATAGFGEPAAFLDLVDFDSPAHVALGLRATRAVNREQ
jgi:hypothetical protein